MARENIPVIFWVPGENIGMNELREMAEYALRWRII
jgi:hypothetical protein